MVVVILQLWLVAARTFREVLDKKLIQELDEHMVERCDATSQEGSGGWCSSVGTSRTAGGPSLPTCHFFCGPAGFTSRDRGIVAKTWDRAVASTCYQDRSHFHLYQGSESESVIMMFKCPGKRYCKLPVKDWSLIELPETKENDKTTKRNNKRARNGRLLAEMGTDGKQSDAECCGDPLTRAHIQLARLLLKREDTAEAAAEETGGEVEAPRGRRQKQPRKVSENRRNKQRKRSY